MGVTVIGLVISGVAPRATRCEGEFEATRVQNNAHGVSIYTWYEFTRGAGVLTPPPSC